MLFARSVVIAASTFFVLLVAANANEFVDTNKKIVDFIADGYEIKAASGQQLNGVVWLQKGKSVVVCFTGSSTDNFTRGCAINAPQ